MNQVIEHIPQSRKQIGAECKKGETGAFLFGRRGINITQTDPFSPPVLVSRLYAQSRINQPFIQFAARRFECVENRKVKVTLPKDR